MADKKNLEKELKSKADKWVKDQLPERMKAVGVEESEVRNQLQKEADQWVQYNVDQRSKGKEGTPSPDFYQHETRPELDPVQRTGVSGTPPDWDEEKK